MGVSKRFEAATFAAKVLQGVVSVSQLGLQITWLDTPVMRLTLMAAKAKLQGVVTKVWGFGGSAGLEPTLQRTQGSPLGWISTDLTSAQLTWSLKKGPSKRILVYRGPLLR